MCPTAFLSMWVSNTATTAMMVPIAQAVLGEIKEIKKLGAGKGEIDDKGEVIENTQQLEMNVINEKSPTTTKIATSDESSEEVRKILWYFDLLVTQLVSSCVCHLCERVLFQQYTVVCVTVNSPQSHVRNTNVLGEGVLEFPPVATLHQ